jgi:hypothetical protein
MQGVLKNNQLTVGKWLTSSLVSFFVIILSLLCIMMIANVGLVNNVNAPIINSLSIFPIMFEQNVSFGQFDPRSGLYLWTLEMDFNTLLAYAAVAIISTPLLHAASASQTNNRSTTAWILTGLLILIFTRTYVTVLAHCAGPTWIGYVVLYGLGADELELTSMWQWLLAIAGCILIFVAIKKAGSSKQSEYL